MRKPLDKPPRQLGSISADELMPMREFGRRLDLHDKALSDAQKAGLRTVLFGRCKFVLGSDAIDFFRGLAADQADQRHNDPDGVGAALAKGVLGND